MRRSSSAASRPPDEADISCCRYTLVHDTLRTHGGFVPNSDGFSRKSPAERKRVAIVWADHSLDTVTLQRLAASGTMLNQFPGIAELTRKCPMQRLLGKMERHFPGEYQFVPRGFCNVDEFRSATDADAVRSCPFICKPSQGCMGRDVVIRYGRDITAASFTGSRFVDVERAQSSSSWAPPRGPAGGGGKVAIKEEVLVQEYIERPLLLHGRKCDLRCYVLVRSMNPLEVHFYQEGMVRCCMTDYAAPTEDNMGMRTMHLANYAVNKDAAPQEGQQPGGGAGGGQGAELKYPLQYFSDAAYKQVLPRFQDACKAGEALLGVDCRGKQSFAAASEAVDNMWSTIHHMVVKTVVAARPAVSKAQPYAPSVAAGLRRAPSFQVLGFDVMVDEDLRPWLIEVNHSPSWHTDTEFDYQLKRRVLRDTMRILFKKPQRRRTPVAAATSDSSSLSDDDEAVEGNGYLQIYPLAKPNKDVQDIVDFVVGDTAAATRGSY